MPKLYFATNRVQTGPKSFGTDVMGFTPQSPTYAVAEVSGVKLSDADAGSIDGVSDISGGSFSASSSADLSAISGTVLVFIHGMANSFDDGIKRAAYLQTWFAASGISGSDTTVIAFTWPSDHFVISPPPALPTTAYRRDQEMAAESDIHLIRFFNELYRIFGKRPQTPRIVLLTHSMGNYVLAGAVEKMGLLSPPLKPLFDRAILAAPDEVFTSFVPANGLRLSHLSALASGTSVYSNRNDVAMILSHHVNDTTRLGYDGPFHKQDPASFPANQFDLADCSSVTDYDWIWPVDSTHQYYRRSARVRTDIASVIAGVPPPAGTRTYQPGTAVYTL
jgi:esterase/lipase superfamily enzyme